MALTKLTTRGITDDAIGLAQMAAGTDGNVITYDASGNPAVVATGTSGHFLKSQGAGSVPVFAAAGGTNELDFFIKNVSQTFTENTDTKVDFSNEQWDTGSAFNTTDKRFVCPVGKAGKYWFAFSMLLTDNCADGKVQYCRLRVNNSTYYWFEGKDSTSFTNDNPSMTCSGIVNLAESDYVEVFLRHNNGSSIIWAQDYGAFWGFRLVQ